MDSKICKPIVSNARVFSDILEDFQFEILLYVYIVPEIPELDDDISYAIAF